MTLKANITTEQFLEVLKENGYEHIRTVDEWNVYYNDLDIMSHNTKEDIFRYYMYGDLLKCEFKAEEIIAINENKIFFEEDVWIDLDE